MIASLRDLIGTKYDAALLPTLAPGSMLKQQNSFYVFFARGVRNSDVSVLPSFLPSFLLSGLKFGIDGRDPEIRFQSTSSYFAYLTRL
jgi:hypothetical protein